MLTLPIKRLWFDKIKRGIKNEEYRDLTDYYTVRFNKVWGKAKNEPKWICLRNGYTLHAPKIYIKCKLYIGTGREEWGAVRGQKYYVLRILEVSNDIPEEIRDEQFTGI
jgi:hypothetical protein